MADNQEEKIKRILTQNGKIELKSILETLKGDISKQTLYNKIRKVPLDVDFMDLIKSRLNIDIAKELEKLDEGKNPEVFDYLPKVLDLQKKIESLHGDIITEQSKRINDKDKIIELQAEIDRLKDKYERKEK
jgi:hypothetical protein